MSPTAAESIRKLREAEKKATPGPWDVCYIDPPEGREWLVIDRGEPRTHDVQSNYGIADCRGPEGDGNAAFIAAARNAVPIILNLIRERGLGHAGSCPASYWLTYPIYGKGDQPCPICICGTDEYMEALALPPPPEGE